MNQPTSRTDEIRTAFAATFDIERELVGGGMSRVFLATERALGRRVVIKVLPPELAAGVNRDRFRQEIQLAAQLQHPHIVPLYAAGTYGDILYYTMPFIEGESLKLALQEHERFTPREVRRILHDVVDALGYAHQRGVIHRDIKPGNVLRSGHHAVVTDFGVAKAISAAMPAHGMTTTGMAIGTPAYMAPEQLAGDPKADHRVDLYAVGLLAYELLTGEMPFAGASPQETMAAQLTRTPEPLDKVRKDVPPELSRVVMWCLAKRPEDRPKDAAALLAALDAIPADAAGLRPHATGRWIGIGAVAAAAAAIAVVMREGPPTPQPAQTPRDTVTVSQAGPPLTRAESLAIASAVEQRLAQRRQAAPPPEAGASRAPAAARATQAAPAAALPDSVLRKMADSIRGEIERAVFDSLARVEAASREGRNGRGARVQIDAGRRGFAPGVPSTIVGLSPSLDSMLRVADEVRRTTASSVSRGGIDSAAFAKRAATLGPARRLVVTEPRTYRGMDDLNAYAVTVADSLRHALGGSRRFVLVDRDTVRQALEKTRTIDDLAQILNADAFASITVVPLRGDSVRWQLTLRDLSAHTAYRTRTLMSSTASRHGAAPGLDSILTIAVRQLHEMDRAPRRTVDLPVPPKQP